MVNETAFAESIPVLPKEILEHIVKDSVLQRPVTGRSGLPRRAVLDLSLANVHLKLRTLCYGVTAREALLVTVTWHHCRHTRSAGHASKDACSKQLLSLFFPTFYIPSTAEVESCAEKSYLP